jgi:hypothetical protein
VQERRSAGAQECRSAGVQERRSAGAQECRSAGAQERRSYGAIRGSGEAAKGLVRVHPLSGAQYTKTNGEYGAGIPFRSSPLADLSRTPSALFAIPCACARPPPPPLCWIIL